LKVVLIQSADADDSEMGAMLAQSSRTAAEYCRRHGYERREYIGVARGSHRWQATFNRILQIKALLDEGFRGWVFHLDADAVIVDLNFDLYRIIPLRPRGMVASASGASEHRWDINAGVFLINLGSTSGRTIARLWHDAFMSILDETLRRAEGWDDIRNDQWLLHDILEADPRLTRRAVHLAPKDILNDPCASFVRHFLRIYGTPSERLARMKAEADAALGSDDRIVARSLA
jgi:hypothetical protein